MMWLVVPILQATPPFGIPAGPDYGRVLLNAAFLIFWVIIAGVAFAIMAPVAMRVFNRVTPGIDEMAELKRGNMAVAMVQGATILAMALLVVAVILK